MGASPRLRVDDLPAEGGIGLWLADLDIGAHGATVEEARHTLVREVRACVANFLGQRGLCPTWPDRARLLPEVRRPAGTRSDDELAQRLFGPAGAERLN